MLCPIESMKVLVSKHSLMMGANCVLNSRPEYFSSSFGMLSGPQARLFFSFLRAHVTSSADMGVSNGRGFPTNGSSGASLPVN